MRNPAPRLARNSRRSLVCAVTAFTLTLSPITVTEKFVPAAAE